MSSRESEEIKVGAIGKLVVPREEYSILDDDGDELDLGGGIKIRRPRRREWIVINKQAEMLTKLILYKENEDDMDTRFLYVEPKLRAAIREELKDVRIIPYYSIKAQRNYLWDVPVTLENSWYESKSKLLKQPDSFFQTTMIRIMSDMDNHKIRVKAKPLDKKITWPTETTEALLGEAIGEDNFIRDMSHPIYQELISGVELK